MASKGVTKTGEAYCMSCGAALDAGTERCESCYSHLDSEVKAFQCPRCDKILELGTSQCPKCSMKFKVKTVRPSDVSEDERILEKLIDWGRTDKGEQVAPSPEAAPETQGLTSDEAQSLSGLVRQMSGLADLRAEVASSMGTNLSEARERISRLMGSDPSSIPLDELESELRSVSQDLARIDELLSNARRLAEDVARTFSMPGPGGLAKGRVIALDIPGHVEGSNTVTPEDLLEREEQVLKREEMVDRKIKAYAQKKKQLDAMEAEHSGISGATLVPGEADDRSKGLEKAMEALALKVRSIHEIVSAEGACDDVEACASSLEEQVKRLVVTKSELEQSVAQLNEGEREVRTLLKTLDGLLGLLPSEAIDKFSKTDEFKLYERVLDRLRI